VDAGDEVVLLVRNQRQWGRHSGIATDSPPYGMVFTLRNGKVTRWRGYPDHESALEAAGVREDAMSQENVEQQYRAADAFSRRDLDAFLAICDPDIELVSRHLELDGSGHLRGHAAVRRWWETLLDVYPDFMSEVEEVRDLGDVTIARHNFRGQGIQSDAPIEQMQWFVTRWRDGKAIWWRTFGSEAEALEAAGLSE
jgi:ketosteroid isomerase-like protein